MDSSDDMTIVIGMMSNSVQPLDPSLPATCDLLLCADTMATHVNYKGMAITSHPAQGKIYPLPHGFYTAFCDTYYKAHEVATQLNHLMLQLDPSSADIKDLVKIEVRKAFDYAYSWYREAVLRTDVGITVEQYLHDPKLARSLRKRGDEALRGGTSLVPAEFIIAGQTIHGPLLLKANGYDLQETTEFHVSGGPSESAISWLKFREQRCSMTVMRSFFHMVEAKRFCQTDPAVSRRTQIVWIPPTGSPLLFEDDGVTTMHSWKDKFGVRDTEDLDKFDRAQFEEGARKAAMKT